MNIGDRFQYIIDAVAGMSLRAPHYARRFNTKYGMLEKRDKAKLWFVGGWYGLWLLMLGCLALSVPAQAQWPSLAAFPFTVNVDALQGAPDAADLNRPLTSGDRVMVHNGRFWRADRSERIRFFGVNLSFAANFPDAGEAVALARHLRSLGFNAVRLHHLDTQPGTEHPPRGILRPRAYPDFNEEAVQRLKILIRALAEEGIYVNLNLRVGYIFRPETDAVPFYEPDRMARPIGSPILVYHPRMRYLQEQYAREVIERLGLRNHPALAMVEINNESSLLAAWQRREWRDAIPGEYGQLLRAQWRDWQISRYGSIDAACKHWGGCDASGKVGELPRPAGGDLAADTALAAIHNKLKSQMAKWWGDGADTAIMTPKPPPGVARLRDFVLFLADTDRRYLDRMRDVVQEAAGFPVPVTGTQMNYGGVLNLTSHAGMDYIDDHFYVDHPDYVDGFSNVRNWRIWNHSLTDTGMDSLIQRALWRDTGKPFVVSELNQPYPSLPGAELLPIMAAFALLQDWDGLFFFDYDSGRREPVAPASFGLRGDWGKYVTVGQVARWFRQGGLAPLQAQFDLPLHTKLQAALTASGGRDLLAKLAREQYGLSPRHAWTHRVGVDVNMTLAPGALPPQQGLEQSPDGTLLYDRGRGVLEIVSDRMLGYMGPQPGSNSMGDGLNVHLRAGFPYHAAVLLSSLDSHPVAASRHLLLTLGSATVGTQPGSTPPRPKSFVRHPAGGSSWTLEPDPTHLDQPSGSRDAIGPAWLTSNEGTVGWRSSLESVTVYPLDEAGRRMRPLPAARIKVERGQIELDVQRRPQETSPWYEIVYRE